MTWLVVVCASLAVAALVPSVPPTARRAAPASASAPALRRVAVAGVAIGAWLFVRWQYDALLAPALLTGLTGLGYVSYQQWARWRR